MLASRGAENSVIKIERTQLSDGSTPEAETRSTSPSLVELWRRPGRRELDWVCRKTEMTEDSADCAREHDGGHETAGARHSQGTRAHRCRGRAS